MIRKSEWKAVHEELAAEDRRSLGAPPTVEELEAYSRGELPQVDEARVRALLVAYPELARAMAIDFPDDDAQPGDDGFVSAEEVSRRLADFRRGVHAAPPVESAAGRLLLFRYVPTAVAAALAIVFAGLYLRAETSARRLSTEMTRPRLLEVQQLTPDGRRGLPGETTITVNGDGALLVVPVLNERHFKNYRLELFDGQSSAPLWRSTDARRGDDDAFRLIVPRELLRPGSTYRLSVSGLDGTRAEQLATYSMRIAAQ
ncbi:MAG TPA: hypothetical protein VF911_03775 [Thermoanaerobaculia bacterium]|jgi:hypothetical protein